MSRFTINQLAERFAGSDVLIVGNGTTGLRLALPETEMRPLWTIDDGFVRLPDRASATFVMDDLHGPAWQAHRNKEAWFGALRDSGIPIITTRHIDEFPSTIAYPLEDVVRWAQVGYFTEPLSYMLAWAAMIGVRSLELVGCDYWEDDRRQQRACAEFWIAMCVHAGIPVRVHPYSKLLTVPELDHVNRHISGFYGYTAASFPDSLMEAMATEAGAAPRPSETEAQRAAEAAGF